MGDSEQDVTCQVCGKSWPADHAICPDDGTWLYEQTIIELAPKKRPSTESPEITQRGMRVGQTTPRSKKYETPAHAMPIRGASTDMIAAQLAPAPSPAEIGPGTQIGEYEVQAMVGEGAMGTVYRAIHPELGKNVAIKVMTPKVFGEAEAVKRFVGEARAVAAIEHPGIVDVFGFGRIPDGRTYLVMEWLDGRSLKSRMDEGPLPFIDACDIVRQIARALEAAHAKGIIHRDLKPENVFLKTVDDEKPMVKLLDFGLAKSTKKDDDAGNVAKTRSGQMLGTPLYMSPEQCKSKGVDQRTDIYALGCMCFELFVGRTPFDADNIAEIITAHLVGEPPRPSTFKADIDPDLDKLFYGMIQKDPARRPPLGEIRRILGMQVSKAMGENPFAHVGSSPFVTPLPSTAVAPQTGQLAPIRFPMQPPKTDPGVASTIRQAKPFTADVSLSDEDMVKAIKERNGPPWYVYIAALVLLGVVATIVVLK